ncbi:hypothetical protein M9H77_30739 [Catharanthus roseus]|uniref:Uncharacterized protein n=1 Tax=Catharanthus roseus TaxID=4058 RepID=A0ACC0A0Q9_CATRO|nr:hypothetical protein M9H77_30739 [Catharanthus roseus]
MDRFEGKILGWHWTKNIRIKSCIGKLGPDTTSPAASNWWDFRSGGCGVHFNPPSVAELHRQATAEDGAAPAAADLHEEDENSRRSLEGWANSASVRRGRTAAETSSSGDCLAEEEDCIGPHKSGLIGSSYSNGSSYFPNLTADRWPKLLTASNNSNNTQFEKLSNMKNL